MAGSARKYVILVYMMKNTPASINIPLSGVKCLFRNPRSRRIVCEIDMSRLRAVNDEMTMDEMFIEAELEYAAGLTKGFTNTKRLMAYLKS